MATAVIDYVDHGSAAILDDMNPVTMMAWIVADNEAGEFHGLMGKIKNAGGQGLSFATHEESIVMLINRATDTVGLEAEILLSGFAAWGFAKWMFVAAVADVGTEVRALVGDLTTAPAEPSSYDAQAAGSGSILTDAGQSFQVGHTNDNTDAAAGFAGDIAFVHVVEAALTNGQIIEQWMRPHVVANSRIFSHYGWNGTGTQPDWSGHGNNGTLTGSPTVVDHAPIAPGFGFDVTVPYAITAAAGDPHILFNRRRNPLILR